MPTIEIVQGPGQGNKADISGEVMIGRAPTNTLCLPDSRASRQHARIHIQGEQCWIEDLGSSNGTFLNRARINTGEPQALEDGDEIIICSAQLKFSDLEAGQAKQRKRRGITVPGTADGGSPQMSVVMTSDELQPANVNATFDASMSMADIIEKEKGSEKGLMEAVKRLQAMVKVSGELGEFAKREQLLERIMDSIFDIFPQADRAFIMFRCKDTGEMIPAVGRNRNFAPGQEDEFPISTTIIKSVCENRQSLLSSDAAGDFGAQQSIVDLSIRSMMCAPFIWKEELLGIINIDTMSAAATFTEEDLRMLTGIAAQAAVALKNGDLYDAVQDETQKRAQLSRYMSPDIVDGVLEGTIPLELGGETKRGTVFFCDIVGFTAMSEKLTAIEVIDKLNRYFGITTEVVTRNRGTLHKFAGDMIMAFWNVLLPDNKAEINAIKASLEMQVAVWGFDLDLESEGQTPIYLGIGCNTGEFAGGNIGGEKSMEYTIIGDNVNLGQRIESMAGRWQVFVSESTYEKAKDLCIAVCLPPVRVKGKSAPISIYSIRGIKTDDDSMFLDIPVRVLLEDGTPVGQGMMTNIGVGGSSDELLLNTTAPVESGMRITVEFETPEIKRNFTISGTAGNVESNRFECETPYTRVILGNLQAEDHVLDFFRPGALIDSLQTWEEMKRH